ncbi:hypothetical protein F5Y08DRAFT_191738 [Xylaria arbuscula]|nr:hypothetical protein F5Y08DRAFT_191738 [Xylaria arbuscula]
MSFTLMPFLYQTRTILRIPTTRRATARLAQSFHTTTQRSKDTIPFDYELGPPNEDQTSDQIPEAAKRGTITPSERQIFERIFADIEARGLKPVVKDDDVPSPNSTLNRSARLIMEQAAYDAGQSLPSTVASPAVLSGAARDRAKAFLRFPPALRGAASNVLDTIKSQASNSKRNEGEASYDAEAANADEDAFVDDDFKAPAHTFPRVLELEAKRYPERTRVEGLITAASSDFELWDVLEKEVFTMPARLGFPKRSVESDDSESTHKPQKRGRKPKSKIEIRDATADEPVASAEADNNNTPAASVDDSSSSDLTKITLYVHGPLYPAYLLLALRRLDTAFSAPSPLVFSMLPRIKELGLESYVLGVSTPFFNELLTIYWNRRGDLSGMLDLLEEMRHCGLYFDKQTASILNQVDAGLDDLKNGSSGLGVALTQMPEYERSQRGRLRHWHRAVDLSAREREGDLGFAGAAKEV